MSHMVIVSDPTRSIASLEKVNSELGTEPDGLIARYAGESGGALHVVSIWDSKAQAETFFTDRLGPALAKVLGPEAAGTPKRLQLEVQNSYQR